MKRNALQAAALGVADTDLEEAPVGAAESAIEDSVEELDDDDDLFGGGAASTDRADYTDQDDPDDQLDLMPARARSVLDGAQYLAIELIHPDPDQPRKEADDELKEDIKAQGVLQPITVRNHPTLMGSYMIVFGERRYRSSIAAGETRIPCLIRDDQDDEATRIRTQLTENTGKPLTPIEEAEAYVRLLQVRKCNPAELARFLKRPASTVHQRLQVLQLGPWIPLVQQGLVSYTQLVEHFLIFAGCPSFVHAAAVALFVEQQSNAGYDEEDRADEELMRFPLTKVVSGVYEKALYPLTKTREGWDKQPAFDTRDHDAECFCGRVSSALHGGEKKRDYCANPDWWKPLLRDAKRAEKQKTAAKVKGSEDKGLGKVPFKIPEGAVIKNTGYHATMTGVTKLLDARGAWAMPHSQNIAEMFDPADLPPIKAANIVVMKSQYDEPQLGTTDTKAIETARAKWKDRVAAQLEQLTLEFKAVIAKNAPKYAVSGPGIGTLVLAIAEQREDLTRDVARALGMSPPKAKITLSGGEREDRALTTWLEELSETRATTLTAGLLAALGDMKGSYPSERIGEWEEKMAGQIRGRAVKLPIADDGASKTAVVTVAGATHPAKNPKASKAPKAKTKPAAKKAKKRKKR